MHLVTVAVVLADGHGLEGADPLLAPVEVAARAVLVRLARHRQTRVTAHLPVGKSVALTVNILISIPNIVRVNQLHFRLIS